MTKKQKTIVSIEETASAMMELMRGEEAPDMLSAFRNSALSCRVQLMCNSGYAMTLRKYRCVRLPDRATLRAELETSLRDDDSGKLAWGLMELHLNTLYAIDEAWFNGKITLDYGTTLASQRNWRVRMVEAVKGMGWKLVSWALFIYDAINCKLMTIDCIHCDRLGIDQTKLNKTEKGLQLYLDVEDRCIAECQALYPAYLPTITNAMLWLNHRGLGVTSHRGISCR